MNHKNTIVAAVVLACCVLLFSSCKKEKKTQWDTEMLVPIANANLSLQNIVKDSSIRVNSDNSLTLAYTSDLYKFSLADQLINIPDTSIGQKFNLTELKLPNQSIKFQTSLGTLAHAMQASPDFLAQFLGNFILNNQGTYQNIVALNGLSLPPLPFDASGFFDSAYLATGEVQVWAVNNLPVDIVSATLTMYNANDMSVVKTQTIGPIPAHDSIYTVIDISNTFITSSLQFGVTNLNTGASNGAVLIDTTDYIEMRMYVFNLSAREAWAKFPTQNVVDITEDVTQEIQDRKFTYVDARQGTITVYVTSSVEEQLYLEYTLIGAYDKNGAALKKYTTVPPAPPGGTITISEPLDIAGYSINLTGKDGSKFNTYTQRVVARIDSSGITRHITSADSLSVKYVISDVAPNYIKGYVGRDTIHAIDSSDFAFLDIFKSGSIDLEDVNMNFVVENGLGVDGMIKINSLTALSANNGSKALTGSIVGQQYTIGRATDFPLTPAVSTFSVNNSNSNIKQLLGILPNKLNYDVEVKTNLQGNTQQYRDFAYLESALKVKLNAEIPLSLIANNLVLRDTIGFDLSNTNTNIEGINDGLINVIIKNKYPIDATLTMVIYDETWNAVDTLFSDQLFAAGDLDNNCRVQTAKRTKVPVYVDEDRMNNVKLGRHAIITATFNSAMNNATCNGQYLKIYSDYNLDVTFTARFNYKLGVTF